MSLQTTDQQNALKDAMARAKEIAAKLQQQASNGSSADSDEGRKRGFNDTSEPTQQPNAKKGLMENLTDPKIIAQQVANSLIQRAHTGPMLVEEILIPNKLVGLVIGKGGEMINKLQSESGAKVQVAPDPPPNAPATDRQVTITGNADAVGKAKSIIAEIQSAGKVPERLMSGSLPGEFLIEMNISKAKVGLIIGKGGETIKSLQERAGCKMVLLQDGEYANTPEKPLRISGEQSTVMYGKQLVQDLLVSKELEGMNPPKNNQQEADNYKEIDVPRESVGLIIGAKGANINQIQSETGCRIRFKNEMEGPTKIAMLSGTPQQIASAEAKLTEVIVRGGPVPRQQPNGPSGPHSAWGGPAGPQGQGPQSWGQPSPTPLMNRSSNLSPGHKDMIVEVPAHRCGVVIGKGGETIKAIKNESKVNIQLNRDVPETSNIRIFSVQGTDEMIEKALTMIRDKIGDQSIVARSADGSQPGPSQNPWGAPSNSPWVPQPQNPQWNQQQPQWPQQPPPQQQQQQQQQPNGWDQQHQQQPQQGVWNQQPYPQQDTHGWNQPQRQQQAWNAQPPWQQPQQPQNGPDQGQWPNQQQWAQPGQQFQASGANPYQQNEQATAQPAQADPAAQANPGQGGAAAPQSSAQPDYSAAWALYYQQQQQYYQQYAIQQQQPGAPSSAPAPSTAVAPAPSTAPSQVTPDNAQAQAMADYQAKLAEYYKQYGQQPPQ